MPRADFLMSLFFIVFGIIVLVISVQMPRLEDQGVDPYSVPGIVPGFLGAIIAFLGGVLLVRSVIRKGYSLNLNRTTVRNFFEFYYHATIPPGFTGGILIKHSGRPNYATRLHGSNLASKPFHGGNKSRSN